MADTEKKVEGDKEVKIPAKVLAQIQEQMAEQDRKIAEMEAKNAGLEEMFSKGATAEGEPKLREKKSFEPKFRTVRLRKYPIAEDVNNLGYVIGWTNRGAYQLVDRTGIAPQVVDYIDVFFLGQERNEKGVLAPERIKLIDLFNKGIQVHCKILETKRVENKIPTGEEIDVTVFDPNHGMVSTGDKIDGYVTMSDIKYVVQIPGVEGNVTIDSTFCN